MKVKLITFCVILVLAIGCCKTKTKTEPLLPHGTEIEVIDGHEYLITYNAPGILGGKHVASRVHKADCKFCRAEKETKSFRDQNSD